MGLETSCDLEPTILDELIGDPSRLRQVLVNILGNAVKFTHQGSIKLRVQCLARSDKKIEVLFTVSDTRIGIPPEKHHLIFQPFTQDDGSMTRRYGGAGLGLAISSRPVELMGGKIWLESAPGQGSTLSFTIQLQAPVVPTVTRTNPDQPPASLLGLHGKN